MAKVLPESRRSPKCSRVAEYVPWPISTFPFPNFFQIYIWSPFAKSQRNGLVQKLLFGKGNMKLLLMQLNGTAAEDHSWLRWAGREFFFFLPWAESSPSGLVTESFPPKSELHSERRSSILLGMSSEVALIPRAKGHQKQKGKKEQNAMFPKEKGGSLAFTLRCIRSLR